MAAIQAASGENPDVIVGKPNPKLFELAMEGLNAKRERIAMIGDNPMTDIKGAVQIGITGILLAKSPPLPKDGDVPTPDVIVPDLSFLFGDDDTG